MSTFDEQDKDHVTQLNTKLVMNSALANNAQVALLIDAENFNYKHVERVLLILSSAGRVSLRRAYADFSIISSAQEWRRLCINEAIEPVMVLHTPFKKNAADAKLTLDAKDILHSYPHITHFAMCTSDGDFAPLFMHLSQRGKVVIGFGHMRASRAITRACASFHVLESGDAGDTSTRADTAPDSATAVVAATSSVAAAVSATAAAACTLVAAASAPAAATEDGSSAVLGAKRKRLADASDEREPDVLDEVIQKALGIIDENTGEGEETHLSTLNARLMNIDPIYALKKHAASAKEFIEKYPEHFKLEMRKRGNGSIWLVSRAVKQEKL